MSDPPLGYALMHARLGSPEAAPSERNLLDHLRRNLDAAGQPAGFDEIAGLLIALKLGRPLVCMAPRVAPPVVGAVARILSGGGAILDLKASIGTGTVMQRFDALRIGDFVSSALEQCSRGEEREGLPAWLLLETGDDVVAAVTFLGRHVRETLRAARRRTAPNLFVLVLAPATESRLPHPWHALHFPATEPALVGPVSPAAVGYARRLVAARLAPTMYRARLRELRLPVRLAPNLLSRWIVGSFDSSGRGILVPDDVILNVHEATRLYSEFHLGDRGPYPPRSAHNA